jgi:Raf kinase inhibitor-like YbhB/YbcL family protein
MATRNIKDSEDSTISGCGTTFARSCVSIAGSERKYLRRSTGHYSERSAMKLTSSVFLNGAPIPREYSGMGIDQSPPLIWSDVPKGTQSFALICEDPDAPTQSHPRPEGPWVHWVIYNIPASEHQLPEALASRYELDRPVGCMQGRNDFTCPNNIGYRGPMPPPRSGPHRYFFRIYALDRQLDLPPKDANKHSLLAAMKGHLLAAAELMATFERK